MPPYDLIIIGTGFAGCTTALSYLQTSQPLSNPPRVALLEAGKCGERSGASRWTGALLRLDKDLNFDPGWTHEMQRVSDGQADVAYCRKLEREARATAEFVEGLGVRLVRHEEKNVLLEFETDQHFVMPEGGGWAIIRALMRRIERFENCDIYWETEARELVTDGQGRVNGVKVRRANHKNNKDELETLCATEVMLACGGFEGNRELLAKYVGSDTVDDLQLIAPGLRYNRGDGLRMAMSVGAGTAGSFDGMHMELTDARSTKPNAAIYGHSYGIVVNGDGERFCDEGKGHLFATFEGIAVELWRGQKNRGFFVTDERIMQRFSPGWVYGETDLEPIVAGSVGELARKIGVEVGGLEKTVREFNAACNDEGFDPMRLDGKATMGLKVNKSNWAVPLRGPYCAFPVTSRVVFTFGGVKVNTDSQVLDTNGVPIPGLWATGEMTGLYYNGNPPLSSVLRCLTFGRLAGTLLAQRLHARESGAPDSKI
ncbi:succinate dehydrogenase/fumarate reductase flavo protein subunit [Aspergillus sclerotiicarbonarius CBS 121057]|uniref:Succinate dehydrogenase/fumarate reductase flavo protein subunit n=1 Tax=Aspergillus sclerotiicarbonarius (strain CBS 121057 / IBT 28362) TaxID=1448318 RepID=A0A319EJ40_ASPSB|nr:succinate dehydrogenase/fumarate reductase flavo protein subunit [Aspergillus sclerotiicarbonarius CBS 121057]